LLYTKSGGCTKEQECGSLREEQNLIRYLKATVAALLTTEGEQHCGNHGSLPIWRGGITFGLDFCDKRGIYSLYMAVNISAE
jgi:hypothetical protein